jgi:hypothetical protein
MTKQTTSIILSTAAASAITGRVRSGEQYSLKGVKFIDVLQAEGITSTMLVAPGKDATEDVKAYWRDLKSAIVAGFCAYEQKLITAESATVKDWSDDQKAERKTAQQKIGAYIGAFKRDLTKREDTRTADEKAEAEDKAAATLEARLLKDISTWITRCEKAESAEMNLVEVVKALKAVAAIANK